MKDIRDLTLSEFIKETENDKTLVQHPIVFQGTQETFYMGFWYLFGAAIATGVYNINSLRCADILAICDRVKAVNLVVGEYLAETLAAQLEAVPAARRLSKVG